MNGARTHARGESNYRQLSEKLVESGHRRRPAVTDAKV